MTTNSSDGPEGRAFPWTSGPDGPADTRPPGWPPAWVAPLVRFVEAETDDLDLGPTVPPRLREILKGRPLIGVRGPELADPPSDPVPEFNLAEAPDVPPVSSTDGRLWTRVLMSDTGCLAAWDLDDRCHVWASAATLAAALHAAVTGEHP